MQVIIVSHTEFGSVRNQQIIYDRSIQGVTEGVPNLAAVADKHGAKVTFAILPETAEHVPDVDDHEIALHIHPGGMMVNVDGVLIDLGDRILQERVPLMRGSNLLSDHPYSEQLAVIRAGRGEIEDRLGVRPTSFVAGRWSLNNDTIRALIECGITRDCSAVAHDRQTHYDWSRLPRICMPYHPAADDYQSIGDLPLIEIPIAQMIRFGSVNPERAPALGISWLKACFREYHALGLPVFHLCLHSPCMADPYFVRVLDELLEFITGYPGVEMATASEVGAHNGMTARGRFVSYIPAIRPEVVRTGIAALISRTWTG